MPINVPIFIHGMTPDKGPSDIFPTYNKFWEELLFRHSELGDRFEELVPTQWGHVKPDSPIPIRDDEKLTKVQRVLHDRVSYDAVRSDNSPNNILMSGIFGRDWNLVPPIRWVAELLRETVLIRGLGDVVYYISEEGEMRVRREVYRQVLSKLDPFLNDDDVRFHLIGHSLGVALTHDFLFGLFAPGHEPDFLNQGDDDSSTRYQQWRDKAQNGSLKLGSLVSMASQLPLLILRKQKLVDIMFNNQFLNPRVIGINPNDQTRWKIFYDIDDVLGFPSRKLYESGNAIMEIQVDSGDNPLSAHTDYWENETVIREAANLFMANSQ